jgi:nickel-dependent lactate racemase
MHVQVAFGKQALGLDLPDGYRYQVLNSATAAPLPDPVAAIEAALDDPAAGRPLGMLARGKKSAAISVCDITRPAPNPIVLPPLLKKLEAAGIARENIAILIATGLHRGATEAEIRHIVGPEVAAHYAVLNHDARRRAQHRHLGSTRSGTPVWIDERFISADLHLSLGFIEPHLMLGFSGGRKLIAPGLAAQETITQLHSPRFMRDPRAIEGSVDDNPLHAELLEIAGLARHDFLIDVALTRDRRIASVFAGEPEAAHWAGVQTVRYSQLQVLEEPVDAVITTGGGYPLDLTFYQCIKGITAASHIVRPGGRILLIGACDEGLGGAEFADMMTRYSSDAEFMRGIERAPVTIDQWQLEKLALVTREKQVLYCLPGALPESHRHFWGPVFTNSQEAAGAFFAGLAPSSRVAVIPEGPYVLASAQMVPEPAFAKP